MSKVVLLRASPNSPQAVPALRAASNFPRRKCDRDQRAGGGFQKNRSANRRFALHKRSQPFICAHNKTLFIAMRGNNFRWFARRNPRLETSANSNRVS